MGGLVQLRVRLHDAHKSPGRVVAQLGQIEVELNSTCVISPQSGQGFKKSREFGDRVPGAGPSRAVEPSGPGRMRIHPQAYRVVRCVRGRSGWGHQGAPLCQRHPRLRGQALRALS